MSVVWVSTGPAGAMMAMMAEVPLIVMDHQDLQGTGRTSCTLFGHRKLPRLKQSGNLENTALFRGVSLQAPSLEIPSMQSNAKQR